MSATPKKRRNTAEEAKSDPRSDRRDSPRIPIRLKVRHSNLGAAFEERAGDIAVGGVFFQEPAPPSGKRVELVFRLPGVEEEFACEGEIVRISEAGGRFGVHVRFGELPTKTELAIARFIDNENLAKG